LKLRARALALETRHFELSLAITVECGGGLRHLSKIVVACPSHVNNIAASQRQQRGKLTGKPSISGHAKLIADFINGIDPTRTSPH
jgi:hypothetical protein